MIQASKQNKLCFQIIALFSGMLIFSFATAQHNFSKGNFDEPAIMGLVKRTLPNDWQKFEVAFLPAKDGRDRFTLENKNGKILISGNNGVAIASGLYYYLKNYAHCQITWNGTNLNLPKPLPAVKGTEEHTTPYDYRYYLNYCTFSYSMVWWDWARWQKEIDWMALHGINFPLALTGQNIVWDKVYKKLGFNQEELRDFFSGPGYFSWFWMGNLDSLGGPLSTSFMLNQETLQKKILARERSLGMKPILPAFTGHVPASFVKLFPHAKVKHLEWGRRYHTILLDPSDPMFSKIGSLFMKELISTYGTDHYYSADVFNENTPPVNGPAFLSNVSKLVYHSMSSVDSQAIWVMQGWLFVNNPAFWQKPQMEALLNVIPNNKMILLDLWSETRPVWSRTEAYFGKPWIWCMLLNFGGNVGMFGRMDTIARIPALTLQSKSSGDMVGIGLTPEGIEQNPVMYELMTDNTWRSNPINLNKWLPQYAWQRYGRNIPAMDTAWQILRRTIYHGDGSQGAPESIITGRPTFHKNARWTEIETYYDLKDVLPAWKIFIDHSKSLKNSDGFQYDLVDLTRQVLGTYADQLQQEIAKAYEDKQSAIFQRKSQEFLGLISDLDRLLSTRSDFLLGKWIEEARRLGSTPAEKDQFERNAKLQITLWSDKEATLHDYACKQWAGMLKGFYEPRWKQFFDLAYESLKENRPMNLDTFEEQIKDWEWNWVTTHQSYSATPSGNSIIVANELYKKYHFLFNK